MKPSLCAVLVFASGCSAIVGFDQLEFTRGVDGAQDARGATAQDAERVLDAGHLGPDGTSTDAAMPAADVAMPTADAAMPDMSPARGCEGARFRGVLEAHYEERLPGGVACALFGFAVPSTVLNRASLVSFEIDPSTCEFQRTWPIADVSGGSGFVSTIDTGVYTSPTESQGVRVFERIDMPCTWSYRVSWVDLE